MCLDPVWAQTGTTRTWTDVGCFVLPTTGTSLGSLASLWSFLLLPRSFRKGKNEFFPGLDASGTIGGLHMISPLLLQGLWLYLSQLENIPIVLKVLMDCCLHGKSAFLPYGDEVIIYDGARPLHKVPVPFLDIRVVMDLCRVVWVSFHNTRIKFQEHLTDKQDSPSIQWVMIVLWIRKVFAAPITRSARILSDLVRSLGR